MPNTPRPLNRQHAADEEIVRMKALIKRRRAERAKVVAERAATMQCAQSDPFFVKRMYCRVNSGLAQDLRQAIGTD